MSSEATGNIKAVVLGAGGYVGGELLRLIANHPTLDLVAAVSGSRAGQPIVETFPHLAPLYSDVKFAGSDEWLPMISEGENLALFSAAPHGASAALIESAATALSEKNVTFHIVDSSADFRYKSESEWSSVYGQAHSAPDLMSQFTCAVPEHLETVTTPHIGHPGCFATATLLAAVPLIQSGIVDGSIFVSGVTGSTGSGRSPQAGTHHPERNSNLYAYKALQHRHTPEVVDLIEAASGARINVNFVPHSGPFARGIHITLQAKVNRATDSDELRDIFISAYRKSAFVQVVGATPKLKNVVASNMCHIGLASNSDSVVVMSTIDNLVKGAAGGAVQWMNRLWNLPETSGLLGTAPGWT